VLLGIPGLINPILSGCTAVVIALIAERRLGPAWGRVAALLYICSPFIAVSAATQMSHIATCLSLALLLYAVDAVADHGATFRMSAVVALTAAFAFFVRPATAVGFGTPLVLSWLFQVLRRPGSMRHLLAFLGAATGPALLFLWVNLQQTGTPWLTGYHTGFAHGAATGFRFVFFGPQNGNTDNFFYFFVRTDFGEILTKFVVVMMRLWHDAWGFPIGLSLALLAPRAGVRRLVGAFVGLLLAHIPLPDAGIDTFGPVHYTELMIVLSLASAAGLQRLHGLALRLGAAGAAPALLAASLFCCGVFYGIPRFATLTLLAADIRAPIDAFESAPPHSIVFTRSPFAPVCLARGTHFVGFRPNNDPRLKNERLWANHIDLDVDRKLLASKPGWKGFLLRHDRKLCKSVLVPFDQATAAEFPPATFLMPGDLSEVPRKK
jgi:hypothetical protein